MSPLQCCELLTKSQVFQKESATIAEESQDHTYKELHDVYHASLLSHSACGQQLCILLKSQTDRILANDRYKKEPKPCLPLSLSSFDEPIVKHPIWPDTRKEPKRDC